MRNVQLLKGGLEVIDGHFVCPLTLPHCGGFNGRCSVASSRAFSCPAGPEKDRNTFTHRGTINHASAIEIPTMITTSLIMSTTHFSRRVSLES
jgi:hypothetical protein